MKDRYNILMKWVVGGGVFCVFLTLLEIWIAELITRNNPINSGNCAAIMIFLTMIIYIIISIVKILQYLKYVKEYQQETLEEANRALDSEFKTVLLRNSADIPKEMFECQAKVDADGKIICKILVDFETEMDSYEEFRKYFCFTEE